MRHPDGVLLRFFWCVLGVLAAVPAVAASLSDTAKEQRWVDQIVDQLVVGDAEFLEADGHDFLAILTEADAPRGGVILVHGTGAHPDWPEVIHPLRTRLPEHGWTTLSIQLPLAPEGVDAAGLAALLDEGSRRLARAVAYLRERGIGAVTVVGHSRGAADVLYFVTHGDAAGVGGLVAVGMNADVDVLPDALDPIRMLPALRVPALDLFGEADLPGIVASAAQRRAAATGDYRQLQISGADHFFRGREEALVEAVNAWLTAQAAAP
jgi:predicted alpha/beta-hydrolase family hydrolase